MSVSSVILRPLVDRSPGVSREFCSLYVSTEIGIFDKIDITQRNAIDAPSPISFPFIRDAISQLHILLNVYELAVQVEMKTIYNYKKHNKRRESSIVKYYSSLSSEEFT